MEVMFIFQFFTKKNKSRNFDFIWKFFFIIFGNSNLFLFYIFFLTNVIFNIRLYKVFKKQMEKYFKVGNNNNNKCIYKKKMMIILKKMKLSYKI